VFLFGILSSPLPYLLIAGFYFIGFATGIFAGNTDHEAQEQTETKNIRVESQSKAEVSASINFHFNDYSFQKKLVDPDIKSSSPSAVCEKEKLIYRVHDIKINPAFFADSNFCRPPPSRS
jgi:hypothetical protein